MQKNESRWPIIRNVNEKLKNEGPLKSLGEDENIPPIVINSLYVPKDLKKLDIGIEDLPNIYTGRKNYPNEDVNFLNNHLDESPAKYIDTSTWTARKETKIRDKWMKVRIRYSGKNLAIIHSLVTLYNVSYS